MDDAAIIKELTEHDNKLRQHDMELRDIKKKQDNVDEMVKAVTALSTRQENVENDVKEIKIDVKEMREKSGKRWDSVVEKVIFAIVGAVVGFLLKQVGVF